MKVAWAFLDAGFRALAWLPMLVVLGLRRLADRCAELSRGNPRWPGAG